MYLCPGKERGCTMASIFISFLEADASMTWRLSRFKDYKLYQEFSTKDSCFLSPICAAARWHKGIKPGMVITWRIYWYPKGHELVSIMKGNSFLFYFEEFIWANIDLNWAVPCQNLRMLHQQELREKVL